MTNHLRWICCLCLVQATGWAQVPLVSSGSVQRFENVQSRFVSPRHIDVWLPADYSPSKRYAVLYMHDGQMLFDSTTTWNKQEWGVDEAMATLIKSKQVRECIVVGVWNAGRERHMDYFPEKPFRSLPATYRDSLLHDAKRREGTSVFAGDVRSDGYLKFLVTELKPFIDKTFSTYTDRDHTFIAGSSMGGLISLYAICEYPDVFGGAACLSTHWPGIFDIKNNPIPDAFVRYLEQHLPSPENHRIYFDFGTETLDAWYEPFQHQVDAVMKKKNYTNARWMTQKFDGADHSERAWRRRLSIPFRFILSPS
jgi:enterochelin esterase-like enzyme